MPKISRSLSPKRINTSLQKAMGKSITIKDMTASLVLLIFLVSILVISIGAKHEGRHRYPCYCKKCTVQGNEVVVSEPEKENNFWLNLFLFIVVILIVVIAVMAVMKKMKK